MLNKRRGRRAKSPNVRCARAFDDQTTFSRRRSDADTQITQQELSACRPVLTKAKVTLVFLLVAVVFIPIGIVFITYGLKVGLGARWYQACSAMRRGHDVDNSCYPPTPQAKEIVIRYDDNPACTRSLTDNYDIQQYLWQASATLHAHRPIELVDGSEDSSVHPNSSNQSSVYPLKQNAANSSALSCKIKFSVPFDMPGPVYVYYEISGIYQVQAAVTRLPSSPS